jgi:hypothetical protein
VKQRRRGPLPGAAIGPLAVGLTREEVFFILGGYQRSSGMGRRVTTEWAWPGAGQDVLVEVTSEDGKVVACEKKKR